MTLEIPTRSPVRPLADLAAPLGVTKAAIYRAFRVGHIGGCLCAGSAIKIRLDAFAYHAEHGYGPRVPKYGTEGAAQRAAASAEAAA